MKKFSPGDEVTLPKKVVRWYVVSTNCTEKADYLPKFGETYTIKRYTNYIPGRGWFMVLDGISEGDREIELPERLFESVMSDNELYSQIDDYL